MNKIKMLTLLTICCVFAGLTAVSAQSIVSQQQIQQKMDHNKSLDQQKLDALKSQTNQGVSYDDQKFDQIKQDATQAAADKAYQNLKNQSGSYLDIPGFTATGDAAVDGPAYDLAKKNFMQNDPEGFRKFIESQQNEKAQL